MSAVKAKVVLKGAKAIMGCLALVDTGAAVTVIDKGLAESIGVEYTGRRRSLLSVSGHRVEGEMAIVKEMKVEDEVLDYERVVVLDLASEVKKALRSMNLDDSIIIGLTTVEFAGYVPDTTVGRLRKVETFLFHVEPFFATVEL